MSAVEVLFDWPRLFLDIVLPMANSSYWDDTQKCQNCSTDRDTPYTSIRMLERKNEKKKKKVNSRCNKQVEWATGKKQKQRHKKIEGEETLFVRFLQPLKRTQSRLSLLLLRTCTESCSISFNYHHGDDRISYAKQVHTKSWFVFQLILAKNISNPWKPIWQSNSPYLFQTVFNWKL